MRSTLFYAGLTAALLLSGPGAAAAPPDAVVESPAASAPTPAELRTRYAGLYRYAGDASEQRARVDAIDASAKHFFFAVRGLVRTKLADRTRIMSTFKLEFVDGNVRSTVPGLPVAVSPDTGEPAPYRVEDDPLLVSQRFEGTHFVQLFKADEGGTRRNEFTLSPDGVQLTMKATLSSPKLRLPVAYTLTYRRAE